MTARPKYEFPYLDWRVHALSMRGSEYQDMMRRALDELGLDGEWEEDEPRTKGARPVAGDKGKGAT